MFERFFQNSVVFGRGGKSDRDSMRTAYERAKGRKHKKNTRYGLAIGAATCSS